MTFPFDLLAGDGRALGMLLATLIGVGFGFALERGGFGRATKLVGQFYLHDMTVFKVMFSAIVTAMVGLVVADGLGLTSFHAIAKSGASNTYLVPMIVGGFTLGAGFIISGYCPGTSLVATASGKLDGVVTFVGVVLGAVLYGEAHGLVTGPSHATNFGQLYLYDIGLPPAAIAAAVVAIAIGCFIGAEKVERIFAERRAASAAEAQVDIASTETPWALIPAQAAPRGRSAVFGGFAGAGVLGLALLLGSAPPAPAAAPPTTIGAEELARQVVEQPWTLRILDLRSADAWAKARVPGSEQVDPSALQGLGLAYMPSGQTLVLVGDGPLETVPPAAAAYRGRVVVLAGGWPEWEAFALKEAPAPSDDVDEAALASLQLRGALRGMLTGVKQAPPPKRKPAKFIPRPSGGGGCN